MTSIEYTITELEETSGVPRRTIHFYIKNGLLRAADIKGGGAKYPEEQYLRLVLIKELQKTHLKLSGIKEALDAMSIDEMRKLASKPAPAKQVWNVNALNNWLTSGEQGERQPSADLAAVSSMLVNHLRRASSQTQSPSESWQRFHVADGVELNIRSDKMDKHGREIKALLDKFKGLIGEEAI